MSKDITHRLVGYDRTTGAVRVEYELPDAMLDFAKRLAGVGDDDPDAVFCYKLRASQARDFAGEIGAPYPDTNTMNFYMEGFAPPRRKLD
jgi:hypothetical protein